MAGFGTVDSESIASSIKFLAEISKSRLDLDEKKTHQFLLYNLAIFNGLRSQKEIQPVLGYDIGRTISYLTSSLSTIAESEAPEIKEKYKEFLLMFQAASGDGESNCLLKSFLRNYNDSTSVAAVADASSATVANSDVILSMPIGKYASDGIRKLTGPEAQQVPKNLEVKITGASNNMISGSAFLEQIVSSLNEKFCLNLLVSNIKILYRGSAIVKDSDTINLLDDLQIMTIITPPSNAAVGGAGMSGEGREYKTQAIEIKVAGALDSIDVCVPVCEGKASSHAVLQAVAESLNKDPRCLHIVARGVRLNLDIPAVDIGLDKLYLLPDKTLPADLSVESLNAQQGVALGFAVETEAVGGAGDFGAVSNPFDTLYIKLFDTLSKTFNPDHTVESHLRLALQEFNYGDAALEENGKEALKNKLRDAIKKGSECENLEVRRSLNKAYEVSNLYQPNATDQTLLHAACYMPTSPFTFFRVGKPSPNKDRFAAIIEACEVARDSLGMTPLRSAAPATASVAASVAADECVVKLEPQ